MLLNTAKQLILMGGTTTKGQSTIISAYPTGNLLLSPSICK